MPNDAPDADTRERTDGATPNGGTHAIAYFMDAAGNPCKKADAHATEIVEYDADGAHVGRTYLTRPTPFVDPFGPDTD